MKISRRGALQLFAGSILGLTGCRSFVETEGKIQQVRTPDDVFQTFRLYKNISEEEVERGLVELAGTAEFEEFWIYNKTRRELKELGFNETPTSARAEAYVSELENGTIYHIHPKKTVIRMLVEFSEAYCAEKPDPCKMNCSGYSAPSSTDIVAFAKFGNEMSDGSRELEFRIADWEGITSVLIDDRAVNALIEHEIVLDEYINGLCLAFQSNMTDLETYRQKLRDIGITIAYRKIRDCPIMDLEILFAKLEYEHGK